MRNRTVPLRHTGFHRCPDRGARRAPLHAIDQLEGAYVTPDVLLPKFAPIDTALSRRGNGLPHAVEEFQAHYITETMKRTNYNQTRAAIELGIAWRTLIDKLNKYGIRRP